MSRHKDRGYPEASPLPEKTRQLLALGREHYEKQDFQKAEIALLQVLDEVPDLQRADVYNMLGVIHHDRGKLDQAREAFEQALAINPSYTEVALNLAVTCNDLGLYDEAKKIYEEAFAPEDKQKASLVPFVRGKIANLHAKVSRAYAEVGLYDEAEQELHKTLRLCPDFADLRVSLAKIFRRKGDLEGARQQLQQATEDKPGYVAAHVALGVVLLSLDRLEEATVAWSRALELEPDHKTARMYLRMAESTQKRRADKAVTPSSEG